MDNFPSFVDLEHMFFFMGDANYADEIENIIKNKDANKALSKSMQKIDLFRWCMNFGFSRIWIYMYITYNLFYTKADLDAIDSLSSAQFSNTKEPSSNAVVVEAKGGSEGMTVEGWDKDSVKKQRLQKCLYHLRRYSTYGPSPYGGFGWAFSKKYTDIFSFPEFAEKFIPIKVEE